MATHVEGRKMFLAGEWVDGSEWIDVIDPQDGTLVDRVPAATKEEMEACIEAAKEGAKLAARMPAYERMQMIGKAADYMESNGERYARTIAKESSKTIREARKEVGRAVETLRLSAEEARRITGETIPFDQSPGGIGKVGYYRRFPLGIIGAITPFNDPLNLVAHKVGPAIAAGNAIIVKPATVTPLSALLLAEAFSHAGLPEKILSVITGRGGEIGDALVGHPAVRMISFTGGAETGLAVIKKAGLKKVGMELGSNSPVIVLQDADLEDAVTSCVSGAFWAAGQNCLGVQRVYIEDRVFDSFKEQFIEQTERYLVGDKQSEMTDMGPLITEKEAKRVERLVQEALDKGATLETGGERDGAFYSPTVLTGVPEDCSLAAEEIFGPVVLLYNVKNIDDAIERANAVDYGLQAGIFTKNLDHAHRAIEELEVGGVMVNDSSDFRIDAMPFGGVKQSGLGREGVKFAIHEMTDTKVVSFKLG